MCGKLIKTIKSLGLFKMWIAHMKWDDYFIPKCNRIINGYQVKSLEHFAAFIHLSKKKKNNQTQIKTKELYLLPMI